MLAYLLNALVVIEFTIRITIEPENHKGPWDPFFVTPNNQMNVDLHAMIIAAMVKITLESLKENQKNPSDPSLR